MVLIMQLRALAFLSFALAAASLPGHAEDLAKWELGGAIGALRYPDYPGADQSRNLVLAAPYLIYRGEKFRFANGALDVRVFDSPRTKLRLSLGFNLPANSSKNEARQGMDNLKPVLEFGPSIDFIISDPKNISAERLAFEVPLRTAFVASFKNPQSVGFVLEPRLIYTRKIQDDSVVWSTSGYMGPIFATADYHEYFHGVDARFATASRPEYHPDAGYSGFRTGLTGGFKKGRYAAGVYVTVDNLAGAAFESGPLNRKTYAVTYGLGISVRLWESDARAIGTNEAQEN